MLHLRLLVSTLGLSLSVCAALPAQEPAQAQVADSSLLTLDRIFDSDEFPPERLGPVRWLEDRPAYVKLEPDSAAGRPGAGPLRRRHRQAGRLGAGRAAGPAGRFGPARGRGLHASRPTGERLLLFTNSRKVWRQNTRGDFWALDLATWQLRKLGGADAKPSTLMFAKFSPDGGRVAYVRENNLYVEDLADGAHHPAHARRLAHHHQRHLRLGLRGGAQPARRVPLEPRRAPDRLLAARRLGRARLPPDQRHRLALLLRRPGAVPQGRHHQLRRARRGRERRRRRARVWLDVPGDPRNNYIARMEWAASSDEVVLQHLNRLQNTLEVMLGDARTGQDAHRAHRARQRLGGRGRRPALDRRRQELHLDQRARRLAPPLRRLPRRQRRRGWSRRARSTCTIRRARSASRTWSAWTRRPGGSTTPPRPTTRRSSTSTAPGSTARASRSASRRRTSRAITCYQISTDGRWAFHTYSRVRHARRSVELVRLPEPRAWCARWWRTGGSRTPSPGSGAGRPEFVKVDAGGGLAARRLGHEAARLRLDQAVSGALPRLRRAGRPDGARPVGRRRLPLAPDAHAAGLRRGVRGQPGHAVAARAAPSGRRSTRRSACVNSADQAAAARTMRALAAGWTRPGSASGAGAAAARRR